MKPTIPHLRLAFWLIAPTVTLWGCSGVSDPGLTEDVRPAYVTAAREASPPSLELVGEVRAAQRAELAFAVAGRVAQILVQAGDAVRQGQVLAVLDAAPFRATVATSQGEVQRALALQEELRQRLDRLSRAQQAGATRVGETEALQAELNASQAVLSTARAQLALAQWSLEQSQLRAPVAGSIGLRALELGQVVTAGAQVISVDGPGRELSVWLPDWLRLQPGQAVNLMKQGAQPWSTRVLRVGSRQEAGGLVRAYLAAPEQAVVGSTWLMRLQHGSAAKVPHDGTTEIPGRAVLLGLREGQGKVLRLARDGKTVEQVEVQVGQARGEWVQITQGLAQGDTVVVAGAAGIAPGTLVRPMPYPLGARP